MRSHDMEPPNIVGIAGQDEIAIGAVALLTVSTWSISWPAAVLFLLAGLPVWVFFATSLQSASRSLLENANLIRKVRSRRITPADMEGTTLSELVTRVLRKELSLPSMTEWLDEAAKTRRVHTALRIRAGAAVGTARTTVSGRP